MWTFENTFCRCCNWRWIGVCLIRRSLSNIVWCLGMWIRRPLLIGDTTATRCNTLQHTETHCNLFVPLYRWYTATHCNTLQHTATHCNTLQHTATHLSRFIEFQLMLGYVDKKAVADGWHDCNTLWHSATYCCTLQHTNAHCNTLQHTATHMSLFLEYQHTATHCNTLQHTATHCNTLQHTCRSFSNISTL